MLIPRLAGDAWASEHGDAVAGTEAALELSSRRPTARVTTRMSTMAKDRLQADVHYPAEAPGTPRWIPS